ncbi:hypothetical protein PoB_004291200, partial [Plakobranchus ocellatus]
NELLSEADNVDTSDPQAVEQAVASVLSGLDTQLQDAPTEDKSVLVKYNDIFYHISANGGAGLGLTSPENRGHFRSWKPKRRVS